MYVIFFQASKQTNKKTFVGMQTDAATAEDSVEFPQS